MGVDVRVVIGWTANKDVVEKALAEIRRELNPDPDDFRDALCDYDILHSDMGGEEFYIVEFETSYVSDGGMVELSEMDEDYVMQYFREKIAYVVENEEAHDTGAALIYLLNTMHKMGRLAMLTYWC